MEHFINGQILGTTINFSVDGRLHKKTCATEEAADEFYNAILNAKENPTDDAVETLLTYLNQTMRIAKENGLDYDLETGEVYLKGFNTPIPELLTSTIEKYYEKNYPMDAILNFWKLLMINPDKRVRESLFDFIQTHDFALTDNGYMVVYKAVELFDTNKSEDLNTFVTNASYHVRKDWSCSPSKYAVYQTENGEYHITKEVTIAKWDMKEKNVTVIGNLGKLNDASAKLSKKKDAVSFIPIYCTWGRNDFDLNKEEIKLGIPQKKERKDCDSDPSEQCSNGLHVGATPYVKQFANGSSVILVCLVNPAHVIAVPDYDHSKMRVCEYFPFALANRDDNGNIDIVEQPYMEHDYIAYEQEELDRQVQALEDEEERVGVDVENAEDTRDVEEVMKALKTRIVDLNS